MLASTLIYTGLVVTAAGLILVFRPVERLHVTTRTQGLGLVGVGVLLAGIGFSIPVSASRVTKLDTHLDEFIPVWQFNERHSISVDAPAERVYDAITHVRADEIFLFRTLTWIRRGGRSEPENILNA